MTPHSSVCAHYHSPIPIRSLESVCVCVWVACRPHCGLFRLCIPTFLFSFVYVVYVRPADIHVGEPGPGVRRDEGGAGPLAAARTSGSGQCDLRCPGAGGHVHLPLAAGALRVSVRPASVVQHRGRARQRARRPRPSEQTTGKSAEHELLMIVSFAVKNGHAHRAALCYAT